MKRRLFIQTGTSTAVAMALTACGGGGGGTNAAQGATNAMTASGQDLTPAASGINAAPVSTRGSGSGYAFGSRQDSYVAGIAPSQSNSTMDSLLTGQYDAWKRSSVISADSVVKGGLAVRFSDSVMTVSEGMGYGMLLAVVFAGHDPGARALFDGLLSMVRARPADGVAAVDPNGKYLMEWRINADGSSGGGGWNAMDGDLDIAMALLMADRQWGSTGAWNYLQEGKNTIAAHKSFNMKASGATKGLPSENNNRTSDYMIGHFRAFEAATGDPFWGRAIDKAYSLLERLQRVHSPMTGLVPDFVINTDSETPAPSTGYIGDGNDKEGFYWWNACRNPWRLASDYVLSGDKRFAEVTGKIIDFFNASSAGNPANIGSGYALDGAKLSEGNSPSYLGPICAGACVDARFRSFLDATWNWNAQHLTTGYYDAELQLLSMVVASGNWWTPATA